MSEPKITLKPESGETTVTDALGRRLALRKPGRVRSFKFFEALGAQASVNPMCVQMFQFALFLTAIDGKPVEPCHTLIDMEALADVLGDEGCGAIDRAAQEAWGQSQEEALTAAIKKWRAMLDSGKPLGS
ncbi:hypothetical protein SAMN02949497_3418 [Methylomagnum ishizawai]|uniref:Tail assembly chaperone n=1 Tax=Methylomagnum ishizawai TaxID=1760988 RepID=A0A1Y6CZD3_9GAMM|nr:hypothetical protein [Methylomagnum ishizawai]SMF96038.1 hypothetical protein SAMN02949497_3418 [Methylomagnum ishizawai]